MSLRIRRGTESQRTGVVFNSGELVWTTDVQQLWLGDGITQGGTPVVGSNITGYGLSYDNILHKIQVSGLTTDDITQSVGANNRWFSTELAQDAVAPMFTGGAHSNISFQYDDTLNKINAVVTLDGAGIESVEADTSPMLGGNLSLNSNNITGTGDINIIGAIDITGDMTSASVITDQLLTEQIYPADTSLGLGIYSKIGADLGVGFYRGTKNNPTTTLANDAIGAISIKGFNGLAYQFAGGMFSQWDSDANLSLDYPSATLRFATGNNSSNPAIASLDSAGVFNAPILQPGSYTTTDRNALTPAVGMMIYNTTDNKFQGYQNTGGITLEWVNLS